MTTQTADIMIVGAGPVGLMCTYLAQICGLQTVTIDKSAGPLEVGRADALNARTLQLLDLVNLFDDLYPLGKKCNTSSVWADGQFVSRQSSWWEDLEGCLHKHFLMLGQSYIEQLLDQRLKGDKAVKRLTTIENIEVNSEGCLTSLSSGEKIQSRYLIGADGSQSFVRNHFEVPFEIFRPQITWAVIDGVIDTDFPKVPEIIVFQAETSDVAWIPREGNIDRFYVRMDKKDFSLEETLEKINRAIKPYSLRFKETVWFSQFSVKESVAEKYSVQDRVFLAGDACHIHSVNGGQGLNTGLADAFNLIWKLNLAINFDAPTKFLQTYEDERRPVAQSVIESSGELVRSTKYSEHGTHAQDYVKIVQKRAGNITGMGIHYPKEATSQSSDSQTPNSQRAGFRLFDFEVYEGENKVRLYSLLDYTKFTLLLFLKDKDENKEYIRSLKLPSFVKVLQIHPSKHGCESGHPKDGPNKQQVYWSNQSYYQEQAILVRPDSYIESSSPLENIYTLTKEISQT